MKICTLDKTNFMKKILIIILAIGCIYLIYKQFNWHNADKKEEVSKKNTTKEIITKTNKKMPLKEDFDKILEKNGLTACYNFDAKEQEIQSKIPSQKEILTSFEEGVNALFIQSQQHKNADNLVAGILENPSDFGLGPHPSAQQIRAAITKGLKEDKDLKISLLPEKIAENSGLFPPEEGESVKDYWIWYVDAPAYFPGPIWILVKRDGSVPAFHYAKM